MNEQVKKKYTASFGITHEIFICGFQMFADLKLFFYVIYPIPYLAIWCVNGDISLRDIWQNIQFFDIQYVADTLFVFMKDQLLGKPPFWLPKFWKMHDTSQIC